MYIKRNIHNDIINHLKRKQYSIITGARQCGKTSLLKAIYNELQAENKI
jgi:predicted AAA+ superfamily ATPase